MMVLTINQNEENITCIAGPNPFYKALKNRIPWTKAANNDQEIMWFLISKHPSESIPSIQSDYNKQQRFHDFRILTVTVQFTLRAMRL